MSPTELLSGAIFGAALLSAGVYAPEVIRAQMSFTSNLMLTVMMGASATSAIVFDAADRFGWMRKKHRPPSELGFFPYDGNIVGGALIGFGMSLTGACPGTALVQIGLGMPNGVLVAAGGVLGAWALVRLRPTLERIGMQHARGASRGGASGNRAAPRPYDIATKLGIPPTGLLLVWVPLCLAAMRLIFMADGSVRRVSSVALVPPVYGGLLIGMAQLASTLLTRHSIGASSAFEDLATYTDGIFRGTSKGRHGSNLLTPSLAFSIGAIGAAAAINRAVFQETSFGSYATPVAASTAALSVAGGFVMVFGARLAGGCTSGHGISGLSKFSMPSLVSTAAMFSAGILTARVFGY